MSESTKMKRERESEQEEKAMHKKPWMNFLPFFVSEIIIIKIMIIFISVSLTLFFFFLFSSITIIAPITTNPQTSKLHHGDHQQLTLKTIITFTSTKKKKATTSETRTRVFSQRLQQKHELDELLPCTRLTVPSFLTLHLYTSLLLSVFQWRVWSTTVPSSGESSILVRWTSRSSKFYKFSIFSVVTLCLYASFYVLFCSLGKIGNLFLGHQDGDLYVMDRLLLYVWTLHLSSQVLWYSWPTYIFCRG